MAFNEEQTAHWSYRFLAFFIDAFILTIISFIFLGATLGKKMFRMKVISEQGGELSFWTVFLRECIGKPFSVIVLGSLWIFFNKKNKEAWDYLSRTVVIRDDS